MQNFKIPRVQIVPQADDQVSFQVNGQERLRWHFGPRYPRPFFFPVIGPSGRPLTRMGHPAAANHDHHKSFWWGHQSVGGVNFWEERPTNQQQVRQESWLHYQDGQDEAGMVVRIGWFDTHKVRLLQQELIAVYRPLDKGEGWLELQTSFQTNINKLELGRTNFGFLGLRVAASISAHYGGGRLTGSDGNIGEKANFARQGPWLDYSGPITDQAWEGITWFDHPGNPHYPTSWHVRDDGWMSAAFCLRSGFTLQPAKPLRLRYGFHVHAGAVNAKSAENRRKDFAGSAAWEVVKAKPPWPVWLRRENGK